MGELKVYAPSLGTGATQAAAGNHTHVLDPNTPLRTSEVTSCPSYDAIANAAITSGWVIGCLAYVRKSDTYGHVRMSAGTTFTTLTDFKVGVWNTAGAVIASSANIKDAVMAGLNVFSDTAAQWPAGHPALASPLALTAGQFVFLGFGAVGQSAGGLRGKTLVTATGVQVPPLDAPGIPRQMGTTGWAGGTLPSITAQTVVSHASMFELLP